MVKAVSRHVADISILMFPSRVLEQEVTSAVPSMEIKDTGSQNSTNQRVDGATFAKFAFASTADMDISRWINVNDRSQKLARKTQRG